MPFANNFSDGTCKWNLFSAMVPGHRVIVLRICTKNCASCKTVSPEILETWNGRVRQWSIELVA